MGTFSLSQTSTTASYIAYEPGTILNQVTERHIVGECFTYGQVFSDDTGQVYCEGCSE